MTEREGLLVACLKAGRDRTPLLVYHDWLMENAHLPAAEATAEFIRVATTPPEGMKPSGNYTRSPVWCTEWLKENWKRLVPTVAAFARPFRETEFVQSSGDKWVAATEVVRVRKFGDRATVRNYEIRTMVGIGSDRYEGTGGEAGRVYPCGLRLTVGFGLLTFFEMKSSWGRSLVAPLLAIDQPQLVMDLPPPDPVPYKPPRPKPPPPADTRSLADLLQD